MKKLLIAIVAFFATTQNLNADEKSAVVYMRELKLAFGDEVCHKALLKYAFADCKFNDLEKKEPFYFGDKNTIDFGNVAKERCLKLYKERVACYYKNKEQKK